MWDIDIFWQTCMSSHEEEKCWFWQEKYWVMCKAQQHGVLVAEWGSHLLIPEVSQFRGQFHHPVMYSSPHSPSTRTRWYLFAVYSVAQWMKGNRPCVLLDPTLSKGHLSIMCCCLGTSEEAMLGTVLLSGMPFTQGHMLLTLQKCWVSQRACLFFYNISDRHHDVMTQGTGISKSLKNK